MKKRVILGSIAGVMLLTLTGCGGGKTLTCTMENSEDGMSQITEMRVSFKNDTATSFKTTSTFEMGEEYSGYLDEFEDYLKDSMTSEFEDAGVDIDFQRDGNKFILTMGADFSEMTDEEKADLGFDESDDNSYDTIKSSLEDSGYTCK